MAGVYVVYVFTLCCWRFEFGFNSCGHVGAMHLSLNAPLNLGCVHFCISCNLIHFDPHFFSVAFMAWFGPCWVFGLTWALTSQSSHIAGNLMGRCITLTLVYIHTPKKLKVQQPQKGC